MSKIRLPVQETENATHVEIDVDYSKGGTNWYSGREEPRGFYVHVRSLAIRGGMTSFVLGNGYKRLLETAPRLNRKRLEALSEEVRLRIEARAGAEWDMVRTLLAKEKLVLLESV